MVSINFTKMQGLGNDFIVLEYDEYKKTNMVFSNLAEKLCNRNFGIGADGLIVLNPDVEDADFAWHFYNSDGTKAQMCGNGMRCFAKYLHDKKYATQNTFSVKTEAGIIIPEIIDEDHVRVNMNKPILECEKIPFKALANLNYVYEVDNKKFLLNAISMGNPHCIIFVQENSEEYAKKYGRTIETAEIFPEKTHVEFVEIVSDKEIVLNVWERGCGITLACGTGACAGVVAGILNGFLSNEVLVHLPGGDLKINWDGNSQNTDFPVFMTGPAEYAFTGTISI